MNRKEFFKRALDENFEAFVMHISSLGLRMTIHLARAAQLPLLLVKKVTMPTEYSDFADVFLEKSANVLPEQTKANKHTIKLEKDTQPPYGLIYNLRPVKLETFKTYINTNLANGFIQALKSPVGAPILFIRKPNGKLCLCADYQRFNNLTVKNWYLLPLIGKSLNRLGQAKEFTQLNLTSVYYWIKIKEGNE